MGMEQEERYQKLGLADALHRPHDYPSACKELSFLLRRAYSKLPKALQSLLFHHTLTAFRLLPQQASSGVSSANLLIQASEAVLPKQRKVLAVSEFKHAVVTQKRRLKGPQENEGLVQLPNDVLVHIFGFLDLRSLAASSLVCRVWRSASSDKMLWRLQYSLFFGKNEEEHPNILKDGKSTVICQNKDDVSVASDSCWRLAFTRKITGKSWSFASGRGYCGNCKAVFWLSGLTCINPHQCVNNARRSVMIKPISSSKVAEYLLGEETPSSALSSGSDSDSDGASLVERRLPKLWAYYSYAYWDQ